MKNKEARQAASLLYFYSKPASGFSDFAVMGRRPRGYLTTDFQSIRVIEAADPVEVGIKQHIIQIQMSFARKALATLVSIAG